METVYGIKFGNGGINDIHELKWLRDHHCFPTNTLTDFSIPAKTTWTDFLLYIPWWEEVHWPFVKAMITSLFSPAQWITIWEWVSLKSNWKYTQLQSEQVCVCVS